MSLRDEATERAEERALAEQHQALYRQMWEAVEAAKAKPPSPAVVAHERALKAALARFELQREADEQAQAESGWERSLGSRGPLWDLPERAGTWIPGDCIGDVL